MKENTTDRMKHQQRGTNINIVNRQFYVLGQVLSLIGTTKREQISFYCLSIRNKKF